MSRRRLWLTQRLPAGSARLLCSHAHPLGAGPTLRKGGGGAGTAESSGRATAAARRSQAGVATGPAVAPAANAVGVETRRRRRKERRAEGRLDGRPAVPHLHPHLPADRGHSRTRVQRGTGQPLSSGFLCLQHLLSLIMLRPWGRPNRTAAAWRKQILLFLTAFLTGQWLRPQDATGSRPRDPEAAAAVLSEAGPRPDPGARCPAKERRSQATLSSIFFVFHQETHLIPPPPPRPHVSRDFHLLNNCIYQVVIHSFPHFFN